MTYQKPINPQRFDQPVYEQAKPKKKTESKRVLTEQANFKRAESRAAVKKPVAKARPRVIAKSKSM